MFMTGTEKGDSVRIGSLSGLRAAIFDFNGTITDDEEVQYQVYADTFEELLGIHFSRDEYFINLAGRPDPEILDRALAQSGVRPSEKLREHIAQARVQRYLDSVKSAAPVRPGAVALIYALRPWVPMAVVTGAPRTEVLGVLDAANLSHMFTTIISIEDVVNGKPDPEGFLLAYRRLMGEVSDLLPWQVVVFEDTGVGLRAARAAGMKCIGAHLSPQDMASPADQTVDVLDDRLLAPSQHLVPSTL